MRASGRPPLLRDPNLHVVFGVTLMAMLGVASVTPAFPQIAEQLAVTPQSVGLLISVFTLPGAILTPFLGVLADRYGRKRILVPSLFLFGIAGFACGFARTFELLVGLRLLQGLGGAALGSMNVTIIGDLYEGSRRTTAFGYNASVLSVGTALYPAIGGALAVIGWFVPFFLPILAVPVGLFVLLVLKSPEPTVRAGLGEYLRSTLRMFRNREVLALFSASVVTFILIYGAYLSYLPFLLVGAFGFSSLWIGLVMATTSIATAVASFYLGRLARAYGEGRLVKFGFVLYVVAFAAIPFATSLWGLIALILVFGAANGINIPSILTMVAGYPPPESRAAFMSVNGMLLRLGQTLGPVAAGAAFTLRGIDGAFLASAGLGAATLLLLLACAPDRALHSRKP
ncbi:MAG: MFS transporter [Gemmatimonadota bacterium]|nr:MAG: MFS transporter [Gemmatimonadota bacterium]